MLWEVELRDGIIDLFLYLDDLAYCDVPLVCPRILDMALRPFV